MRSLILAPAIVFAGLGLTPAATASPVHHHHHARAAKPADPIYHYIKQAYAYMDYGWSKLDTNTMWKYVAPDAALYVISGRQLSRAQFQVLFYQIFQRTYQSSYVTAQTTITRCVESPQAYTIYRTLTISVAANDSNDPSDVVATYKDVWMPTAGGWLITYEALLSEYYPPPDN